MTSTSHHTQPDLAAALKASLLAASHHTKPEAQAVMLADVIKAERPEHMYGRKPGCLCRDCLLWDAEQLLRELAAAVAGRDTTGSTQ